MILQILIRSRKTKFFLFLGKLLVFPCQDETTFSCTQLEHKESEFLRKLSKVKLYYLYAKATF